MYLLSSANTFATDTFPGGIIAQEECLRYNSMA